MELTVSKIGSGTEDDPIRPETDAKTWVLMSETETTMTIDIMVNLC